MQWHVETLILDRVFDVQRPSMAGGRTITSDFSFEAQGRTMYGVNAPGMPSLKAGDRVSFVRRAHRILGHVSQPRLTAA